MNKLDYVLVDGNEDLIEINGKDAEFIGLKLSHYTSLEGLKGIIKNQCIYAQSGHASKSRKNFLKHDKFLDRMFAASFSKADKNIPSLWRKNGKSSVRMEFIFNNEPLEVVDNDRSIKLMDSNNNIQGEIFTNFKMGVKNTNYDKIIGCVKFTEQAYLEKTENGNECIEIDNESTKQVFEIINNAGTHELDRWKHEEEVVLRVRLSSVEPIRILRPEYLCVPLKFSAIKLLRVVLNESADKEMQNDIANFLQKEYRYSYQLCNYDGDILFSRP